MDQFFAELDKAFTSTRRIDGVTIRTPERPVVLDDVADALVDELDMAEYDIDTYGPARALHYEGVLPARTLVDFDWTSEMPMSSDVQIETLVHGAVVYICVGPDGDMDWPWMAIAAVEPFGRAALETFLADFLSTGGAGYQAEFLGGLPTGISTDPELISREGVAQAIEAWVQKGAPALGYSDSWGPFELLPRRMAKAAQLAAAMKANIEADSPENRRRLVDAYVARAWGPLEES